jgi:YggT family protein
VSSLLQSLGLVLQAVRGIAFGVAALAAAACAVSWATRTRRLGPFTPLARLSRSRIDPALGPVERAVRRAGGSDASVPWWGLAAVVVGAIVSIQLVEFVVGLIAQVALVLEGGRGPSDLIRLALSLALRLVELAIIVRVVASWLPTLAGSRWIRWSYPLSEWLLAPLRRVLPTFGPIDVSPLVALLLLQFVGGIV